MYLAGVMAARGSPKPLVGVRVSGGMPNVGDLCSGSTGDFESLSTSSILVSPAIDKHTYGMIMLMHLARQELVCFSMVSLTKEKVMKRKSGKH